MDLGEAIEHGGNTTHGVHSFIGLITKVCLAFYSFKYGYKLIFNGIGGVPLNSFISVLAE